MKTCWLVLLVCGLLMVGCGEKETTTTPAPVPAEKASAVEQVKKSANEAATQATKMVEAGSQLVKDAGVAAEETVKEVVTTAKEDLTVATATAKEKAVEVGKQIKQEGTDLITSVKTAASGIKAPETVVIENKNGNVTLPHAEHGEMYGCATCHGDNPPGPFELGKDTAHKLCKDCHKEQGGPTKCSGCHVK
ncbi:hypothetical protein SAMN05660420_01173 [Desulfuromusa kysingii]|uniref:Uncharacterized protein n=1 Tax=Desulfuromusa kysingii TaxID=37625 RepID=A0A1H3YBZ4_9BACT|nr:cytochrome c3 family protein [Desulfuromusa kysingii]SEA09023.1 hypothetical protein SAMN05660420_01173 [Desulfuromusa kysingii]